MNAFRFFDGVAMAWFAIGLILIALGDWSMGTEACYRAVLIMVLCMIGDEVRALRKKTRSADPVEPPPLR